MAQLDAFGIAIDLPSGFEGEIFGHPLGTAASPPPGELATFAATSAEDSAPPVAHVATFPLPVERGDFGNGAVDIMSTEDIFIALCEYDEASASSPLFEGEGIPQLTSEDFATNTLHRSFPHHSGCQKFFHVGNRAFCLYVVLGSHSFRGSLVRRVNEVLSRIDLAPR